MPNSTGLPVSTPAIHDLCGSITGEVITPDDPRYDGARACFNLVFDQYPALVVMAANDEDVVGAVRYAADHGLDIAVQATGHGLVRMADGALLINTSPMTGVAIDPIARTARVEAGAKWGHVLAAAQRHGLAPLLGSSSDVGAVGYTLGGGFGWLGRKHGLASDTVVDFDAVTAGGERLTVSAGENADLFWGLRGGGGGLAVVTAMTVRLFPVQTVYGGRLVWPADSAAAVLRRWRDWLPTLPEEMTTSVKIMSLPDMEFVPAPLRGQTLTVLAGCFCGPLEEGAALMDDWRAWRAPIIDDFRAMPFAEADEISQDPQDPVPAMTTGAWLRDLSAGAIDTIVRFATMQEGRVPLIFIEIRHAGGAVGRAGATASAFGHRDAELLLDAVYMVPAPPVRDVVVDHMRRLKAALRPAMTGTVYMNFLEGEEKNERVGDGFPAATLARLAALKERYDPDDRLNRAMHIIN
ncbi:MAG: FAD-binding oxidoreductase [Candidatus Promineofilum sp.]|nr:FAD-binding oxidoreductase [Promineifilum sp.]